MLLCGRRYHVGWVACAQMLETVLPVWLTLHVKVKVGEGGGACQSVPVLPFIC